MKEFTAPNMKAQSFREQSKSYNYSHMHQSPVQSETIVLEKEILEQVKLIEDHPLGFARCQVFDTYIIAEARDKLIIVDQHAAHERLVYECLKQKSNIIRQKLLIPEVVEIKDQAGMEMIEIYKDKLFEMGFDIEIKSENKVIVK